MAEANSTNLFGWNAENRMIGGANDSVWLLESAIAYLQSH